ncbi:MAG: histidine kinase dimerization/phospho-acceptor domain-containing protein, partial [Rhizobacter sp.]
MLFGCLLLPTVTATQSLRADWKAFVCYSLPVPLLGVAYFVTRPGFGPGNAAATVLPLMVFEALLTAWAYRSYTQLRSSILVRINAETLAQQRLQALAVAEERSRVKSQFMATMTHELRTPLYGILGLSQLARGEHSREALLQRLDLLDKSGESLLGIIDDLLDFSQLESGEVSVHARRVDLHALVREVQGVAAHTALNKGLDLLVDVRLPTPCVVACDPMRVRQVLLQLLGNAFKFTEEGSVRLQVGLEAAEAGLRVRFAVTDTGIGIDAQHLPHIFEPFHQVDDGMSRRYGGV